MSVYEKIKSFAEADVHDASRLAKDVANVNIKRTTPVEVSLSVSDDEAENAAEFSVKCSAQFADNYGNGKPREFEWRYKVYTDKKSGRVIAPQYTIYEIADKLVELLANKVINSATILGADEDEDFEEFEDFEVEDPDSGTISDDIADISDQVDDLQDSLEELDEDDPSIEPDNNIDNHYIAECERCNGIFISAVIESDQVVESITGTCPLCGKDTDQDLLWVIKKVDKDGKAK